MCVCGMAWAEIDGKEQKGREKTEVTLGGKAYEGAVLLFSLSIWIYKQEVLNFRKQHFFPPQFLMFSQEEGRSKWLLTVR